MKKVPKSLQAILITFIVGMLLPNVLTLSGNVLADKITWKIVGTSVFSISTLIVGFLYSSKLITGKASGGKTRILIYLFIIIMLCSFALPFLVAFAQAIQWLIYLICGIILAAIIILIVKLILKIFTSKKSFKKTQEKSISTNNTDYINKLDKANTCTNLSKQHELKESNPQQIKQKQEHVPISLPSTKLDNIVVESVTNESNTLFELWENRDVTKKCLKATNFENLDLKWVKIYKPPYYNGKFYGYILMNDARNTVNGEIYFADRKIWKALE